MSRFAKGDRVYHRTLKLYGTYIYRERYTVAGLEPLSYVLFDDDHAFPHGRSVTDDDLLEPAR
jgi:hypothetical protein